MRAATLVALLVLLVGCETMIRDPVATKIGTEERTPRRYHYLAEQPFGDGLVHTGFIVAIEKAPKAKVGEGAWSSRIKPPSDGALDARVSAKFAEVMAGTKAMLVTHILAYAPDRTPVPQQRMITRFLYNLYPNAGAEVFGTNPGALSYEERGWRAIEGELLTAVRGELQAAATHGAPYTHLLIGSMGWDNDQVECLRRFNAVLDHALAAARRDGAGAAFNPLLVGITWPSVWGWPSWFDIGALAYKLFGYANKADDADEIGFGLGNWLVNRLGTEAKLVQPKLKLVVFGHSFGARITSRAVFSRAFLSQAPAVSPVDLYLGLQGAFSVHRFIKNEGNEGSPYAGVRADTARGLRVVLTASHKDTANPLAVLISGAHHVGGGPGLDTAKKLAPDLFEFAAVQSDGRLPPVADPTKVLYIDATKVVLDHNDVLDMEMGALVWSAIRAFAPAPSGG